MQTIVLCAGQGSRLGMNIPKCLVQINNQTLLENIIRAVLPHDNHMEFIVVSGFKSDLVETEVQYLRDTLHSLIHVVHNIDAEKYSIIRSLQAAASLIKDETILRISGDLFFDRDNTLGELMRSQHTTLAIQRCPAQRGLTPVAHFSLNSELISLQLTIPEVLDWEWADLEIYKHNNYQHLLEDSNDFMALGNHHFNLINRCMDNGMYIKVRGIKGVYEIDTPEDLEYVNRTCAHC